MMNFWFLNTICTGHSSVAVVATVAQRLSSLHIEINENNKHLAIMSTMTGYIQVDYCMVVALD